MLGNGKILRIRKSKKKKKNDSMAWDLEFGRMRAEEDGRICLG